MTSLKPSQPNPNERNMTYWNIPGETFDLETHCLGNRELTVFGRPGQVGISCDPDDDNQSVQLTMRPDEWRQVAKEILRVCDLAETKVLEAAE